LLTENDHIVRRYHFEAGHYEAPSGNAKQSVDGHDVEVRHSTYVLGTLKHDK
jgi:hypothetical protein